MNVTAAAAAALSCSELGTSTDDSAVDRQTPVNIKFTPSLTYAEKLLLKKNRRMELPMPELLTTSRSCDSVIESTCRNMLLHDQLDTADDANCNNSNRGI